MIKAFIQKHQKAIIKRLIALLVIIAIILYSYILKVVDYTVVLDKLHTQNQQKTLTMAVITDLHSCYYGDNQATLVRALKQGRPDVILLGGDIYDDVLPFDNADKLLLELPAIAPTFYVDGNHEHWLPKAAYDQVMSRIAGYGIKILHGKSAPIAGTNVVISGVSDPDGASFDKDLQAVGSHLDTNNINVLLSHRPERIDDYQKYSVDVVISGHAHGGQWRVPFLINGVYAPSQGFLPSYAGGQYVLPSGQNLIVSRGLARESTKVPRLFNRPELLFIQISTN